MSDSIIRKGLECIRNFFETVVVANTDQSSSKNKSAGDAEAQALLKSIETLNNKLSVLRLDEAMFSRHKEDSQDSLNNLNSNPTSDIPANSNNPVNNKTLLQILSKVTDTIWEIVKNRENFKSTNERRNTDNDNADFTDSTYNISFADGINNEEPWYERLAAQVEKDEKTQRERLAQIDKEEAARQERLAQIDNEEAARQERLVQARREDERNSYYTA